MAITRLSLAGMPTFGQTLFMTNITALTQPLKHLAYTGFLCGVLVACSSAPHRPALSDAVATVTTPAAPKPEHQPTARLERDTLLNVLSGEIAARRMLGDEASHHMLAAMARQPDEALAARTARIAHFFKDDITLDNAAQLWRQFDPEAAEPLYLRAVTYTRQGRLGEAFDLMETLLNMGADTNFTAIVSVVSQYPEHGEYLHSGIKRLRQTHATNLQLILSEAILSDAAGRSEMALQFSNEALAITPDNYAALHIKARALQILERHQEAIDTLLMALDLYPETTNMRLHLARMLTTRDLAAASEQFAILVEQAPNDANLRLSLALSLKELGRTDEATAQFNTLLDMGRFTDESNYYLAQIYRQSAPDLAEGFSLDISRQSHYFIPGLALYMDLKSDQGKLLSAIDTLQARWLPEDNRSASIALLASQRLSDIGMPNESAHLLSRAIAQLKDRTELRYTLALMQQRTGDIDAAQATLEANIEEAPEHAASLNALGYLLAERGSQLQRAESLIARAIELRPNDAAIIDSMGWVLFKQGDSAKAAKYLTRAHQLLADPEIASHLVEVLWHLNRRIEASDVIRDALQRFPDSPLLQDTVQRLNILRETLE